MEDKDQSHVRKFVWQSNRLVNARYEMGYIDQRIFLQTLAQIKLDDEEFREIRLSVRDLYGDELNGESYKTMTDACSRLMGKNFEIEDILEGQKGEKLKRFRKYALYDFVEYVEKSGEIRCRLAVSMMPHLLQLRREFTQGVLDELLPLNSHYSFRIYWLLMQYAAMGGVREIDIEELRSIFKVKEDQYKRFVDFRRRVIDRAQADLSLTSMAFNYEIITHKKRAVAIRFRLKNQKQRQLELFQNQPDTLLKPETEAFWQPENPVFDLQFGQRFKPSERFPAEDLLLASRMLVMNGVDAQGCERWYQAMMTHQLMPKQVIGICKQAQETVPQQGSMLTGTTMRKRGGWIHKQLNEQIKVHKAG
ncbi:Initiator Replication protein [Catalinimonas alkaloidigena]|uniref:Initiator Replication protein n=1 Tax=Catalinimonas alkaloidigena TaxID=1075417 RepID=A0A1G9VJY7_9BACT|nr:replication initiation protein [Catalinimonas alkaloidigena]SDM72383.1 Initiator Replication protein [Catalinimonas alkaloidigena]